MELPHSSPAKCELPSVIRFLNAKNNSSVEIHLQLVEVYGEKCMDIKNVRKWSREFNEGRINVHDEQRSGRPSLPESTVARIDEMVRANRRLTLEEIEDGLNEDCSHFSVHKIVSETLGYRKVSARENLIEEVERKDIKPIRHYLPHRPIYKVQSETTPIRPIYDASCKASKRSLSLNECLETGPNLIELLPEILVRFREKRIGAIADIRKTFQIIGIDEKERDYLRFLWWDEQDPSKIRTLRHTRVVFGLTCSPFILAAVLKYHLESIVDYRKPVADVLKTFILCR
ncbi:hypothetical protein LAZ67_11002179 [Cordylochernes scorpioides]|uniref:Mos1 transposase HTH domain-containing protein n=1 Tax=Cordylochernes scorpioides TaxID=51811 RepID=A0ABY6L0U1_9ARAC|nr:hypothetical protein LAZ67_11002179 [Cordylochernes scorpioides]